MGWKQSELDRMAKVRAENRRANQATPGKTPDRSKTRNMAEPGKTPDRSKTRNEAEPGKRPDRSKSCERRRYVVTSKKCAHGKLDEIVELEATGAVLALVEAGALRLYVKAAIKADAKEASDG